MKIKHADTGHERLLYVCEEPDIVNGAYYVDFVTVTDIKEAIYTTEKEAKHKIQVLNKILKIQKEGAR